VDKLPLTEMTEVTVEEAEQIRNQGICPDCGERLFKGPRGGGALNVSCPQGHTFWVALGFTPERITPKPIVPPLCPGGYRGGPK
jgi:hypothetical protein